MRAMDNAIEAMCQGVQSTERVRRELCETALKFTSVDKDIVGKSGTSYKVPMIRIPKGAILYSGNAYQSGLKPEGPGVDAQAGMWFSWNKQTADGYSPDKRSARTYVVSRDIDLLDLWTPGAWGAVFAEVGDDDFYVSEFAGLSWEVKDPARTSFVKSAQKTGLLPTGKCDDADCETIQWKGLTWGPKEKQYKRYSRYGYDNSAIEKIYRAFPSGFDGIFSPPLPSPMTNYAWRPNPDPKAVDPIKDSPFLHRVFHEEINLRPGYADKVQYTPAPAKVAKAPPRQVIPEGHTSVPGVILTGGRTRRLRKKSTRTRTTKKK